MLALRIEPDEDEDDDDEVLFSEVVETLASMRLIKQQRRTAAAADVDVEEPQQPPLNEAQQVVLLTLLRRPGRDARQLKALLQCLMPTEDRERVYGMKTRRLIQVVARAVSSAGLTDAAAALRRWTPVPCVSELVRDAVICSPETAIAACAIAVKSSGRPATLLQVAQLCDALTRSYLEQQQQDELDAAQSEIVRAWMRQHALDFDGWTLLARLILKQPAIGVGMGGVMSALAELLQKPGVAALYARQRSLDALVAYCLHHNDNDNDNDGVRLTWGVPFRCMTASALRTPYLMRYLFAREERLIGKALTPVKGRVVVLADGRWFVPVTSIGPRKTHLVSLEDEPALIKKSSSRKHFLLLREIKRANLIQNAAGLLLDYCLSDQGGGLFVMLIRGAVRATPENGVEHLIVNEPHPAAPLIIPHQEGEEEELQGGAFFIERLLPAGSNGESRIVFVGDPRSTRTGGRRRVQVQLAKHDAPRPTTTTTTPRRRRSTKKTDVRLFQHLIDGRQQSRVAGVATTASRIADRLRSQHHNKTRSSSNKRQSHSPPPQKKNNKTPTSSDDEEEDDDAPAQQQEPPPPPKKKVMAQVKLDGDRMQAHLGWDNDEPKVRLFTKNGFDVSELYSDVHAALIAAIVAAPKKDWLPCVLDGELIVVDARTGAPLPWESAKWRYNKNASPKPPPATTTTHTRRAAAKSHPPPPKKNLMHSASRSVQEWWALKNPPAAGAASSRSVEAPPPDDVVLRVDYDESDASAPGRSWEDASEHMEDAVQFLPLSASAARWRGARQHTCTVAEEGARLRYVMFDVLMVGENEVWQQGCLARWERLKDEIAPLLTAHNDNVRLLDETRMISTARELVWLMRGATARKLEGYVLKAPDAPYVFDRTNVIQKMKLGGPEINAGVVGLGFSLTTNPRCWGLATAINVRRGDDDNDTELSISSSSSSDDNDNDEDEFYDDDDRKRVLKYYCRTESFEGDKPHMPFQIVYALESKVSVKELRHLLYVQQRHTREEDRKKAKYAEYEHYRVRVKSLGHNNEVVELRWMARDPSRQRYNGAVRFPRAILMSSMREHDLNWVCSPWECPFSLSLCGDLRPTDGRCGMRHPVARVEHDQNVVVGGWDSFRSARAKFARAAENNTCVEAYTVRRLTRLRKLPPKSKALEEILRTGRAWLDSLPLYHADDVEWPQPPPSLHPLLPIPLISNELPQIADRLRASCPTCPGLEEAFKPLTVEEQKVAVGLPADSQWAPQPQQQQQQAFTSEEDAADDARTSTPEARAQQSARFLELQRLDHTVLLPATTNTTTGARFTITTGFCFQHEGLDDLRLQQQHDYLDGSDSDTT